MDNCASPNPFIPDIHSICDISLDCDWCSRNHLSFDFLCCETGKWIGPHLTNPMLFYLMWNDLPWSVIMVFFFEVFEASILTMLNSGGALFADKKDSETLAASLVGDALIQGGLGIFIGYCIRSIFLLPTLVSTRKRALFYAGGGWARFWYIFTYAIMAISYLMCGWKLSSGLRIGLILQTFIMLIFIVIVIPFGFTRNIDNEMLWQQLDGTRYGGWHKFGAFATWALVVLVAHFPHFATTQPWYSTNEWFMSWLLVCPLAAILGLGCIFIAIQRGDGATAWATIGLLAIVGNIASWVAYGIGNATAKGLLWLGLAFLFIGIVCFIVSAAVDWRIPSAESITRRGSKRTALPAMAELPQEKQKDASKKVRIAEAHIRWM